MTRPMPEPSSRPAIPQATDVERAVLGAIFRDPKSFYEVIDLLTPDAFCHRGYRRIWEAMQHLASQDQPIDVATVVARLQECKALDACGGSSGLMDVVDAVYTAANIRNHAEILLAHQKRRALQALCHDTLRELDTDPVDLVNRTEGRMLEIAEMGRGSLLATHQQIERMITADTEIQQGRLPGYSWPLPALTRTSCGIRPGRIYLIIGLFKSGKSKLAIATMQHLITQGDIKVLFLSLEMGATQVFHWLAGCALKIDTALFDSTKLSDKQMQETHQWIIKNVSDGRLTVNDRAIQTPESICAALRRAAIGQGAKVVFIDYLQRIVWGEGKVAVSDIARGMNLIAATAKRLGVAVIALSQVPKSVEQQPAKLLINLGDVKDAAAFAETADASISITDFHRHKEMVGPDRELKLLVEQRDGPTKVLEVRADLRYGHFASVVQEERLP